MKGFYTFEEAAHGPLFEAPERVRAILSTDGRSAAATLAGGASR